MGEPDLPRTGSRTLPLNRSEPRADSRTRSTGNRPYPPPLSVFDLCAGGPIKCCYAFACTPCAGGDIAVHIGKSYYPTCLCGVCCGGEAPLRYSRAARSPHCNPLPAPLPSDDCCADLAFWGNRIDLMKKYGIEDNTSCFFMNCSPCLRLQELNQIDYETKHAITATPIQKVMQ